MKKFAALAFAICYFSCKQSHSQQKLEPDSIKIEAIKLNHEAFKLYLKQRLGTKEHTQALKKAIKLLNKAMTIDSNYLSPYINKLAIQDELNELDSAFLTAKLIVKKAPKNESIKMILGKYYELKGDTTTAFEYYQNALAEINNKLSHIDVVPDSTKNSNYIEYKFYEIEKAKTLLILNQTKEGHSILKGFFDEEKNESLKRHLKRIMFMNRQEFCFILSRLLLLTNLQ